MTDIVVAAEHFSGASEASIVTWLFTDGTYVKKDEAVCEAMVEKTQFDVLAPASGKLSILIAEGEVFSAETVLGSIDESAT
jgi:pyruvate/2-oxoglutarate dehydrogenase complex dihydrolipoamide acyltransferase (E2) component